MTGAAFALIVLAVVVMVLLHRKLVRDAVARMEAQVLRREAALDKQAKQFVKHLRQTERGAAKAVDAANGLHKQIQLVLCDPKIQQALNEGVAASGR